MFSLALVNPPFGGLIHPSFGLHSLEAAVKRDPGLDCSATVRYLNHDLARVVGPDVYWALSWGYEAFLGDWLFRHLAFPEADDNSQEFLAFHFGEDWPANSLARSLLHLRAQLDGIVDRIISDHELATYDGVGLTCFANQSFASFAIARKLRAINPRILLLAGGPSCTHPMGQTIVDRVPALDYVFSGPAVRSLPEFLRAYLSGQTEIHIKGVLSRGRSSTTADAVGIGDDCELTDDPDIEYDLFLDSFEKNFPNSPNKPIILFRTSRGCWWAGRSKSGGCTFCGLNTSGMDFSAANSDKAADRIQRLFRYADRVSCLEAVDNTMPQSLPRDVLSNLKVPDHLSLFFETRPTVKDRDLDTMAKAHVFSIQPGIEALNSELLKLMNKGADALHNVLFLKRCCHRGIVPIWHILAGFPGDKDDYYEKYLSDLPKLVHLPPPDEMRRIRFDRYSRYFDAPKEYGLALKPLDVYRHIFPFDPEVISQIAYHFDSADPSADFVTRYERYRDAVKEVIDTWRTRWFREREFPRLHFVQRGETRAVFDSRGDESREYVIDNDVYAVLSALGSPARAADIPSRTQGLPRAAIDRSIALVRERSLVMEEGERMVSLVHPNPVPVPPHLEFWRAWNNRADQLNRLFDS